MVCPTLHVLLILATSILQAVPGQPAGYPENKVGGLDLEVIIHLPPTSAGEGSKEKDETLVGQMLGYKSDQAVEGGGLNNLDMEKGYPGQEAEDRMGAGNGVVQLVKRSAAEERQMNGRIRILKKRDNYNMDGRIRILKRAEHEMSTLRKLLEGQNTEDNTESQRNLVKRADNNSYDMDGRVRILK